MKDNARVAQLVERDLAKVEAAGSSPVSRSITKERHPEEDVSFFVIEHLKSRRDDLPRSPKVIGALPCSVPSREAPSTPSCAQDRSHDYPKPCPYYISESPDKHAWSDETVPPL